MIIVEFPTVEKIFQTGTLVKLVDKKGFSKEEMFSAIAAELGVFGSILTFSAIKQLGELAMLVIEKAAEEGHAYFIKMMLDHWDDEKNDLRRVYTRYFGYAFSAALIRGDVDIARMIYGENQGTRNTIWIDESYVKSGRTPLMLAKESGNIALIELLEKTGIRAYSRPVATPLSPLSLFRVKPEDAKPLEVQASTSQLVSKALGK